MGKLEYIPKKQVFNVPENYFDKLPAQIQSRISTGKTDQEIKPVYRYALRYALPLLLVFVIGIFFYKNSPGPDAESILTSVQTSDLVNYLNESELSTEDLLENVDFSRAELEAIENEVYDLDLKDFNLDDIYSERDLNTL